ncbi:hypothetical protein HDA32_003711 [Spinactinospora alkalitolerans]|uniref:CHAT domain-containing protein n=1 Tax=Spinactinospora alkalitolerans TaxID=687207 RepID=A0A852TXU9_9ACTN|nr:CHAT domain-containing protein [Spinactinospora alkalitolerans]NYE48591.1 hypothetical protein [Spinactinospora alkalitolerans]
MLARHWVRAAVCGSAAGSGARLAELRSANEPARADTDFFRRVGYELNLVAELSGYAAHKLGMPFNAPMFFEGVSALTLEDRAMQRVLWGRVTDDGAAAEITQTGFSVFSAAPREVLRTLWARFGPKREYTGAAMRAKALATLRHSLARQRRDTSGFGNVSHVGAVRPEAAATLCAEQTGATLVYISTSLHAGYAVKVPPGDPEKAESVELPDLAVRQGLQELVEAVRKQFDAAGRSESAATELLRRVGSLVVEPVLRRWPELRDTRVVLVPVGETGLLPLFGALVDDRPVGSFLDLTVAPSARTMLLSSVWPENDRREALVVADPTLHRQGTSRIPHVLPEVRRVAEVHGARPRVPAALLEPGFRPVRLPHRRILEEFLDGEPGPAALSGHEDLLERMAGATDIHFACHGRIDDGNSLDSSLLVDAPLRLEQILRRRVRSGALVVLSACEVGGISREAPGEQLGFPSLLLAAGARAVVGPLWPIPDSRETAGFMADLHRLTRRMPSNRALGHIMESARTSGVSSLLWAPMGHFGTPRTPPLR